MTSNQRSAGNVSRRSEIRSEVERFLQIAQDDPALQAELESLVPGWGHSDQGLGASATLPDVEPFRGIGEPKGALLKFMRHWSEELRAAGWYGDLECFLATVTPGMNGSPDGPPENFQAAYQSLIEQAGGWFTYGPDGHEFVRGTYVELVAAAERWAAARHD